jgi:protein tyrosine/serine phosphatase
MAHHRNCPQDAPFMKTILVNRLSILVTLALLTSAGFSQQVADHKKLPNFHEVNSKLYRGAQPATGGVQQLASLGIKTIVNLRGPGEGVRKEEVEAQAAGLRYFSIPFDRMGRPDEAEMKQVLSIIDTPENQPVFVHCKQGADRTGTVIAIYRITHDGWTSEQAKAEANRYGMHPWERGMKDYIHDYYQRHR